MSNITTIKCVVIGDEKVGKTSLIRRLVENNFSFDYKKTIVEYMPFDFSVNKKNIRLNIWDTAGQEDLSHLRQISYNDTDVFFVCFSIVNPESFENVKSVWFHEAFKCAPDAKFILVGTKSDLKSIFDQRYIIAKQQAVGVVNDLKMIAYFGKEG